MKQHGIDRLVSAVLVALVATGCATTPAGPTLGDMLDKGAKKASNEEIRKQFQVGGPALEVVSPAGAKTNTLYREDGTFDGTVQFGSASSRSTGKWTLDANGRFCMDEKLLDWNKQAFKCYFTYMLGEQVVVAQSMTEDRAAPTVSYPRRR